MGKMNFSTMTNRPLPRSVETANADHSKSDAPTMSRISRIESAMRQAATPCLSEECRLSGRYRPVRWLESRIFAVS